MRYFIKLNKIVELITTLLRMKDLPKHPIVSIVAPSLILLDNMKGTEEALNSFYVPYEISIVAAHRAPKMTIDFATGVESKGIEVIIAGGAGSAHLPGMIASLTTIPVIGVPLQGSSLDGMDSLFSMVQMPQGVAVGTMGINAAYNAGIFACQVLSAKYSYLKDKLRLHKGKLEEVVGSENKKLEKSLTRSDERRRRQ
jgi:5-(carboxyamino)imidazole ribonucleotide mutase